MSLFDIYKSKRLGINAETLQDVVLGKKMAGSYETIIDSIPYVMRQTANGENVGSKCKDTIVGGSLAWNQHANVNNPSSINGITVSYSNNVVTLNGTATAQAFITVCAGNVKVVAGHKYILRGNLQSTSDIFMYLYDDGNYRSDYGNGCLFTALASSDTKNITILVPNGKKVTDLKFAPQLFDLTELFGSTIANYIANLESSKSGAGIAYFRKLFPNEVYVHSEGIQSVNTSARITRDADNNIVGDYKLDETLILRGVPKLDANNQLYYDGDTYESDGKVTRKYKLEDLGSLAWDTRATGNTNKVYSASLPNNYDGHTDDSMVDWISSSYLYQGANNAPTLINNVDTNEVGVYSYTNGGSSTNVIYLVLPKDITISPGIAHLVYKLTNPSIETADSFADSQKVKSYGSEEYVDYSVLQGTRDVSIPVGHNTEYQRRIEA